MASKQEQALSKKLNRLGYPIFVTATGEDDILMLYVQNCHICSVDYALSLPDESLKEFIDETVQAGGQ